MTKDQRNARYHSRNKGFWYDLLLNGLLPLLLGWLLYNTALLSYLPAIFQSHLADGLWAYAFASVLLIAWNRVVPWAWMLIAMIVAAGFEWLQAAGTIPGTADWKDGLIYLLAMGISIGLNPYFRKRFSN